LKLSYRQGPLDEVLCDEIYLLGSQIEAQLSEITSVQEGFVSVAEKTMSELNATFTEKAHDLERLGKKAVHALEQSDVRERALVKFSMRWILVLGVVSSMGILY